MGIGRQSLYDTFGDQPQLFLKAINRYNRCITQGIVDQLGGDGLPIENIRKTSIDVAEGVTDGECRGCLLTNNLVETAPHDDAIAEMARSILGGSKTSFRKL